MSVGFRPFCGLLLVVVLLILCVDAKKDKEKHKEKDKERDETKDRDKEVTAFAHNQPAKRPQYINQFSESLRFLSSFFQVLQRQLNTTIETYDPDKPNPILSALLSNPGLIPFALKRLRDPLSEMITITRKIEGILASDTPNVENNQELKRLLVQLQRKLQTTFGLITAHREAPPDLSGRIPLPDLPNAVQELSNFINQFAAVFAAFSQSVRDYSSGVQPQTKPVPVPLSTPVNRTEGKSDLASQVDDVCFRLQTMHILSSMTNSSDLTLRQEGMGSILQGFLSGVVNLMSNLFGISSDAINGVLINLLTSFNQAFSPPTAKPATGELGPDLDLDLFSNLSFGDSIQALLPLTSRRTGDLHQMTFGVINNKNRLIVTNIVSKEVENKTSIGDQREVLNQLSLNGLHSMMERLVSRMNNDTEPMYLASLQCQLEGLGCSLRQRQYFQVQLCLQALTSCLNPNL